jgi:serine protease
MSGVPVGSYQLYAGTDLDGNAFIDNAGEAFGAYPTLLQPMEVQVDGDVSGIEFSVSALVDMQQAAGVSTARAGTLRRAIEQD